MIHVCHTICVCRWWYVRANLAYPKYATQFVSLWRPVVYVAIYNGSYDINFAVSVYQKQVLRIYPPYGVAWNVDDIWWRINDPGLWNEDTGPKALTHHSKTLRHKISVGFKNYKQAQVNLYMTSGIRISIPIFRNRNTFLKLI